MNDRSDKSRDSRQSLGAGAGDDASPRREVSAASLFEAFRKRAGKVAGGTLDIAMDVATMSAMFGDSWIRDLVSNSASPERLQAMADAGRFLRDARETAGLSIQELSERLELKDKSVLEGVERGDTILPLELMLRTLSLLARHDPVPFLIKFLRSYNPQLEATLEQWGVMALPRNYERERRFLNLYRQHDFLRDLSDDAHQRFIEYMDSSTQLVVDVMQRESEEGELRRATRSGTVASQSRAPAAQRPRPGKNPPASKDSAAKKRSTESKNPRASKRPPASKGPAAGKRSAVGKGTASNKGSAASSKSKAGSTAARSKPAAKRKTSAGRSAQQRPVVRKVKPRHSDS